MMNKFHDVFLWALLGSIFIAYLGNYCHLLRIRDLERQAADHARRVEWVELQVLMIRNHTGVK